MKVLLCKGILEGPRSIDIRKEKKEKCTNVRNTTILWKINKFVLSIPYANIDITVPILRPNYWYFRIASFYWNNEKKKSVPCCMMENYLKSDNLLIGRPWSFSQYLHVKPLPSYVTANITQIEILWYTRSILQNSSKFRKLGELGQASSQYYIQQES